MRRSGQKWRVAARVEISLRFRRLSKCGAARLSAQTCKCGSMHSARNFSSRPATRRSVHGLVLSWMTGVTMGFHAKCAIPPATEMSVRIRRNLHKSRFAINFRLSDGADQKHEKNQSGTDSLAMPIWLFHGTSDGRTYCPLTGVPPPLTSFTTTAPTTAAAKAPPTTAAVVPIVTPPMAMPPAAAPPAAAAPAPPAVPAPAPLPPDKRPAKVGAP